MRKAEGIDSVSRSGPIQGILRDLFRFRQEELLGTRVASDVSLRMRTAPAIRPKRGTVQERIGGSYGADENTARAANVVSPEKAYCIAVLGSISWIP